MKICLSHWKMKRMKSEQHRCQLGSMGTFFLLHVCSATKSNNKNRNDDHEISTIMKNDKKIAIIHSDEVLIKDVQSALDLMMTVQYETDCDRIVLNKSAICEDFFT